MTLAEARARAREQHDFAALIGLIPYAAWLGMAVTPAADGQPVLRLPFQPMLTGNPALPAIHGGVIAGFMESAAMLHLLLRLDQDRIPKSIDFSIDYLRSARTIETHAACEVERLGRRVAQVQVRCWQDAADRPIALARAHFLLAAPD
ncbi:MAG: PaaI family thioesterase [Nevskia sp.]